MNKQSIIDYIKTQLEYDHKQSDHSSNTEAMVKIVHDSIVTTVNKYAKHNKIYLLDIGCGWGDFSEKLDDWLEDYIGVEPSKEELKRFEGNFLKSNRYLIRGFGEYLNFIRDNSRNVILLTSVLDHCFDWHKTVENCKRILCPGGIIIIAMENSNKLSNRIKSALGMKIIHDGHLSYLSGDELKILFAPNL